MNVAVIGCGYVGLSSGAVLASMGHSVVCADKDRAVVESLRSGRVHIPEPGLQDLVASGTASGGLRFTTSAREAVGNAAVVLVCTGTPSGPGGHADLSQVYSAYEEICAVREERAPGLVVATKSTIPPGTTLRLRTAFAGKGLSICSNPEFLREGSAVRDCIRPDRIVIGSDDPAATQALTSLYSAFRSPVFVVSPTEAELIKYASNAFLALKVSFINEMAELCEALGADVTRIAAGAGADPRIGGSFLEAGIGFGGPCLPKDLAALIAAGGDCGVDMAILRQALARNTRQRERSLERVRAALGGFSGRKVAVWGVTFKEGSGDTRQSPSLDFAQRIARLGGEVICYDPALTPECNGGPQLETAGMAVCDDKYEAVAGADALLVLTGWDEFRWADWPRVRGLMRGGLVFDGRNVLPVDLLRHIGFEYMGIGCGVAASQGGV